MQDFADVDWVTHVPSFVVVFINLNLGKVIVKDYFSLACVQFSACVYDLTT